MLAQRAERFELDTAVRLWAPVYLRLVDGALQVLVEAGKGVKRSVAYEAFERRSIPRAVCRPRSRARSFVPSRPTDQPVGVRYDIPSVQTHDPVVNIFARHA